jgi:hypothetical protein
MDTTNLQRRLRSRSKEFARYLSLSAFLEVTVTTALSLVPLLAIGLVAFVKNTTGTSLVDALFEPVNRGQLFLYCFSTLATVLWLIFYDSGQLSRITIGPLVVILILYVVLLLGVDPQMTSLTNPTIIESSYYIYTISVFLHLIILSIKNAKPPSVDEAIESGVGNLEANVDALARERGERLNG